MGATPARQLERITTVQEPRWLMVVERKWRRRQPTLGLVTKKAKVMANLSRLQRENLRRISAAAHARRALNRKHKGELIPTEILKKLAAMNLPPHKRVYNKHLTTLLRSS
jgi:hypothetical protein